MKFIKLLTNNLISGLSIYIILISLNACTSQQTITSPDSSPIPISGVIDRNEEVFWWAYRFKVNWPPESQANNAVDLLLAHSVVKPVLEKYANQLARWRFHRRHARDDAGHQFSFIFYSNRDTAINVIEEINGNIILNQALADNIVIKTIIDDPNKPVRPEIEGLSDPSWSVAMQKNWPSYIMGVSALWLGLIDDAMSDTHEYRDNDMLLEQYKTADTKITSIWKEEGQHALLHHLNAIFGYEALLIRKETRF